MTVEFVRRLRPYLISNSGNNEDPYVREILEDKLDKETLVALDEYTRGMYSEDLHYNSFMTFSRPVEEDDDYGCKLIAHPSFLPAFNRVRSELRDIRVTPIPSNQLDRVIYNPVSAAGYGYTGLKRDNYLKARSNASRALYDFDHWRSKYRFVPDRAFARSQLALRANPKIRHVWGRAFHHILLEGCIAQPIIEKLMYTETPIYIGKDLHIDMPHDVIQMMKDGGTAYCLDFSRFDARLPRHLITAVWFLIEELVDLSNPSDRLTFEFCQSLFQNTPLVMPDGRLFNVRCGLPSGTYFTQLLGSIVNLLLIYMLQHHYGYTQVPTKVLGDDSIFVLPDGRITLAQCVKFFDQFGMIISPTKSIVTKNFADILFLGHQFYGSRVTRNEFTCLSLALFSEDRVLGPAHSITRIASLVYDCGYNSFGLYQIYKDLNSRHNIDWIFEDIRPATTRFPFVRLFALG